MGGLGGLQTVHSRDGEPVVHFAGDAELVDALDRACPRRVVRLKPDDRYY
jgi:hypothetical protein